MVRTSISFIPVRDSGLVAHSDSAGYIVIPRSFLAIQLQDVDTVEFLIQSGADVNLRWILNGEEKLSPMEYMLICGDEELMKMGAYFRQLEE
jgi:hypothetical protein